MSGTYGLTPYVGISAGSTYFYNKRISHSFISWLMSSLTLMFGCSAGAKGRAGLAGVVGIQGSSHTLTSYHECTLCLIPNNNNFRAAEISAHTYDGLFAEIVCKGKLIM